MHRLATELRFLWIQLVVAIHMNGHTQYILQTSLPSPTRRPQMSSNTNDKRTAVIWHLGAAEGRGPRLSKEPCYPHAPRRHGDVHKGKFRPRLGSFI